MVNPPHYYKFLKSIENSQQFKILNDLVTNSNATVDNAILQTIDLTMAAHAAPDEEKGFVPSNIDYFISLSLMMLVQELEPTKHGRLIEFLCALQKQIATDPSTGEPLTVDIDKEVLWTNLPSLGYTEVETWREFGGDYTDPYILDLKDDQRKRWVKLSAFIAQLTQAADISYEPPLDQGFNYHPLDRSHRAAWTFQFALENDDVPMPTLSRTAAMEATCMWFIYAADRLWDNVRYGRTYDPDFGLEAGCESFEGRGWKGYERDRWEAWGERLRAAMAVCEDERMRGLLDEALGCRERAMTAQ